MKQKIKSGDEVIVLAGNSRGERATVLQVLPQKNRVLLEGVNKRKFHERAKSQEEQGGITEREVPVHLSNVMLASRWDERQSKKGGAKS